MTTLQADASTMRTAVAKTIEKQLSGAEAKFAYFALEGFDDEYTLKATFTVVSISDEEDEN